MSAWIPAAAALMVEAGILSFIAYLSMVLDWEARKVEEHQRKASRAAPRPLEHAR